METFFSYGPLMHTIQKAIGFGLPISQPIIHVVLFYMWFEAITNKSEHLCCSSTERRPSTKQIQLNSSDATLNQQILLFH